MNAKDKAAIKQFKGILENSIKKEKVLIGKDKTEKGVFMPYVNFFFLVYFFYFKVKL
jgi:hypothetical protein